MHKNAVLLALVIQLLAAMVLKQFTTELGPTLYRSLSLLLAFAVICFMLQRDKWTIKDRPIIRPVPALFFVFGAIFVALLSTKAWFSLMRESSPTVAPGELGIVGSDRALSMVSIVMSVIVAPLREELIYRHGFMRIFRRHMTPVWALLLSSVVFLLSHVGTVPAAALPPVLIGGLLFGVVYQTLGLRWAVVAHFIANAQPLLNAKGLGRALEQDWAFVCYLALALVSIWIFAASLVRLRRTIFASHAADEIH